MNREELESELMVERLIEGSVKLERMSVATMCVVKTLAGLCLEQSITAQRTVNVIFPSNGLTWCVTGDTVHGLNVFNDEPNRLAPEQRHLFWFNGSDHGFRDSSAIQPVYERLQDFVKGMLKEFPQLVDKSAPIIIASRKSV